MTKFLKKFNFLPGIILIIIFVIPARLVENIARIILRLMNNLFAYFDYMGVSGGYLGMFYEKLIVEGVGVAVYCAGMLLFPMYLNKRFFKKFEINWLPGIILVFLFFGSTGLFLIYIFFFKALGKMDWIDTISYLVTFIGYSAGFLTVIYSSLKYSETKNKFVKKILDKFE
jgi:hypothetical protein